MPEPNDHLRTARMQIRSPTTGHPLARAEVAERVNAWVAREFGQVIDLSSNYIGKLERGTIRWPSTEVRAGLRSVLGAATDIDLGFYPPDRGVSVATLESIGSETPRFLSSAGEGIDDVLRRTFLINGSVAGLGVALGLESARRGLNAALPGWEAVDIADWYETVRDYGETHTSMAMRDRLLVDLLNLEIELSLNKSPAERRELCTVGALLAHYMAQAVGDLGEQHQARRWWRTARRAADSSENLHIMLYIRGREAIRAIYDGRPPQMIIDAIDEAEGLMQRGPATGLPSLLAARAQSHALLGDDHSAEAESSLDRLREVFDALPSSITSDHGWHCWAYPEERIRFAESFVYSHLGNAPAAEAAQDAALDLYPPGNLRGPLQIELQRALCLVRTGDIRQGAGHATATLERLPCEFRTRFVMGSGEQVHAAVPRERRREPTAIELYELLKSDREQQALKS